MLTYNEKTSETSLTVAVSKQFTSKYEQVYVKRFFHTLLIPCKLVHQFNPFGKKSENNMSNHKNVHTFGLIQRKIEFLLCTNILSTWDSVAIRKTKSAFIYTKYQKTLGKKSYTWRSHYSSILLVFLLYLQLFSLSYWFLFVFLTY